MTDFSRDEAKSWIMRNWKTLPPDQLGEAVKRYFLKYGEKEPEIIKEAKKIFEVSDKQDTLL